jgi:hypothetical protein
VSVGPTPIPGLPLLPPGSPAPSFGVAGVGGGSPIPGLPSLPPALTAPRFPPSSRYAGIEITALERPDGQLVPYLRRRFVPDPDALAETGRYAVEDGDRLDRISAARLGDPQQFWRLCDGNRALDPG